LRILVTANEYIDKLVDYSLIKINGMATVKETHQTWSEEDDFSVEKPQLTLIVNEEVRVGREFRLEIRFTNPINRVLQESIFTIEGPGIMRPLQLKFRDIQPYETISQYLRLIPQRAGQRSIVVAFHSKQLTDISGSKQVLVLP
jgi:transglutaminase 1